MDSKLLDLFIANLSEITFRKGINKTELAKMLNVSPQTVTRYFSKENSPTLSTIETIAKALGIEPTDLLTKPEKSAPSVEYRLQGLENEVRKLRAAVKIPEDIINDLLDNLDNETVLGVVRSALKLGVSDKPKKKTSSS